MNETIEMVSFTLKPEATEQELIAASEKSQSFIRTLPGFLYRSLSKDVQTEKWVDVVYWDSLENAKAAGDQFMSSEVCLELLALIDKESVQMEHGSIKMSECSQ